MRRALAAAAAATLFASGLAACSGDSDAGLPPTSSTPSHSDSSTSTMPTSPTESAESTGPGDPPALPEAAKHQTRAGAKAFVRHFVVTLNFSWLTLATTQLRGLSLSECRECSAGAAAIDEVADAGGSRDGGSWIAETLTTLPSGEQVTLVQAVVRTEAGRLRKSKTATSEPLKANTLHLDFGLVWRNGRWFVQSLDVA